MPERTPQAAGCAQRSARAPSSRRRAHESRRFTWRSSWQATASCSASSSKLEALRKEDRGTKPAEGHGRCDLAVRRGSPPSRPCARSAEAIAGGRGASGRERRRRDRSRRSPAPSQASRRAAPVARRTRTAVSTETAAAVGSPVTRMASEKTGPVPGIPSACEEARGWRRGRRIATARRSWPSRSLMPGSRSRTRPGQDEARAEEKPGLQPPGGEIDEEGCHSLLLREPRDLVEVALRDLPVLQEGEDERPRRAVKDAGDEVVEHLRDDAPLRVGRPVDEGLSRLLPLQVALLREEAEHRHDGRVGDGAAGRQDVVDLLHRRVAELPDDVHDLQLDFGEGARLLRHTKNLVLHSSDVKGRSPDAGIRCGESPASLPGGPGS